MFEKTKIGTTMSLLFEKLTYRIKGCAFDVHNALGVGYDEESYHRALEQQLKERGISFESKVIKYIEHRGEKVHKFVVDLIVDNKVILELKYIQTNFHPTHYVQILSYQKCWQKDIGFLVNFGLPSANIKRVIFKEKRSEILEDYSLIRSQVTFENRELLRKVRNSILNIYEIHGFGYATNIYQKTLLKELTYQRVPYSPSIFVPLKFRAKSIRNFEVIMDLNLPYGLLVHFGKGRLEIHAIRGNN